MKTWCKYKMCMSAKHSRGGYHLCKKVNKHNTSKSFDLSLWTFIVAMLHLRTSHVAKRLLSLDIFEINFVLPVLWCFEEQLSQKKIFEKRHFLADPISSGLTLVLLCVSKLWCLHSGGDDRSLTYLYVRQFYKRFFKFHMFL